MHAFRLDPRFTFIHRARGYILALVIFQLCGLAYLTCLVPQPSSAPLALSNLQALPPTSPLPSPPPSLASPLHPLPTPRLSPPLPPPPVPLQSLVDVDPSARSAFLDKVHRLQHPSDCRTASLYVYRPTPYTSGLGSQMRIISNSMLHAMSLGRTFVLGAAASSYINMLRCPDRSYSCIFEHASSCTLTDAFAELPSNVSASAAERLDELSRDPIPASSPGAPRVIAGRSSCFKFVPTAVDSDGAVSDPLWYAIEVAGYLARPNEQTAALTEQLRLLLGLAAQEGAQAAPADEPQVQVPAEVT